MSHDVDSLLCLRCCMLFVVTCLVSFAFALLLVLFFLFSKVILYCRVLVRRRIDPKEREGACNNGLICLVTSVFSFLCVFCTVSYDSGCMTCDLFVGSRRWRLGCLVAKGILCPKSSWFF